MENEGASGRGEADDEDDESFQGTEEGATVRNAHHSMNKAPIASDVKIESPVTKYRKPN